MSKFLEFATPASKEAKELASDYGLVNHGLKYLDKIYWNLPDSALYEESIFRNEAHLAAEGPLIAKTGKHTARSAADKFIVKEESTESNIWWGVNNRPLSLEKFNVMMSRVEAYLQGEEVFVQDCYVGADPDYRMPIRIITEKAWHSLFARNMFLTTSNKEELKKFVPEFTVITVPGLKLILK